MPDKAARRRGDFVSVPEAPVHGRCLAPCIPAEHYGCGNVRQRASPPQGNQEAKSEEGTGSHAKPSQAPPHPLKRTPPAGDCALKAQVRDGHSSGLCCAAF